MKAKRKAVFRVEFYSNAGNMYQVAKKLAGSFNPRWLRQLRFTLVEMEVTDLDGEYRVYRFTPHRSRKKRH